THSSLRSVSHDFLRCISCDYSYDRNIRYREYFLHTRFRKMVRL
ncbi:binding--dependent transport system inner membrane component family protein, partial [Chlamydia psittaci 84-8471/1]